MLVVAMASALLALLMFPKPAHACTCASSGSPREAMADADAVFFGKVAAIQTPSPRLKNGEWVISSADPVTVEFDVIKVWKGSLRKIMTIETERSEISCGFEFKEGRRYVVYAYDGYTGLCTRTAPAWLAIHDFAALGSGQEPESPAAPDGKLSESPTSDGAGCNAPTHPARNRTDFAALGLLAGAVILGARPKRRL